MPNSEGKGFYYRRLEDIPKALCLLLLSETPLALRFIVLYAAAEKMAWNLIGLSGERPAFELDDKLGGPNLDNLKKAAISIGLSVSKDDLDLLFKNRKDFEAAGIRDSYTLSARRLRDGFFHDLGPTKIANIERMAPTYIPLLEAFIAEIPVVLSFIDEKYQGVG